MTRRGQSCFGTVTFALLLAGCATAPTPRAPTVEVAPAAERVGGGPATADAAAAPAFGAAPAGAEAMLAGRRVAGFVAGTDKKAGLYVYGLDGRQLQFLPDGLLNNVDLRAGFVVDGREQVLIGASDRGRMGIALYLYDPASSDPANAVRPWGLVPSDVAEPYGFCMAKVDGAMQAILIGKDGQLRQYRIDADAAGPRATELRRLAIGSQSEGCVADEEGGHLYVGEELVGLWRYGLAPGSGAERVRIEGAGPPGRLIADVEGATMIRDGAARYVIVSSQGDSAFAVWRVDGPEPVYAGRFSVAAAGGVDPVTGTDGVDALGGPVGPFPEGLVVVQDDVNETAQNFKLIDWRAIRAALGLARP